MIVTTLNAVVGLVAALYFFAVVNVGPAVSARAFIREQWRSATDGLYETFRGLPAVLGAVVWFVALVVVSQLGADIATVILALGVPLYLAGCVALRGRDRFRAWMGKREMKAHPGAFALPMRVQDSNGAVNTWSDRVAVPSGKSILALGATRSGKTEAVKHFLQQLGTAPNSPTVVYDRKDDFRKFYEQRGAEYIRLSSTEGGYEHVQERTARWNLFRELEHGADPDALARSLFPTGDAGGSGGSEFFNQAARQLFGAVVTYLNREVDSEDLDNAALVSYFRRTDAKTMYEDLTSYEDLTAAASAINPDASRQSAGVYASVQQRVSDLFVGEFGESGEFSVREYMANPDGRVLLLDYPEINGETVGPIFGFLIDECIRAGLSRPRQDSRYVLDEFATLPNLRKIDDLVNVGAGKNCSAVVTLQSIGQLNNMVGKQRANSLLAGLSTSIILRMQDPESVRYARQRIGRRIEEKTGHVERQPSPTGEGTVVTEKETKQVEEHEFSEQDLQQLPPGYAIVAREDGWASGQLAMLPEPRHAH